MRQTRRRSCFERRNCTEEKFHIHKNGVFNLEEDNQSDTLSLHDVTLETETGLTSCAYSSCPSPLLREEKRSYHWTSYLTLLTSNTIDT